MGDYKNFIYARHPERYANVDVGDISQQLQLKKDLNCKDFRYFFDTIAPEMLEFFPMIEHTEFAHGTVSYTCIKTY